MPTLALTSHSEPGEYRNALPERLSDLVPAMPAERFWALVTQIDWGAHERDDGPVPVDAMGAALRPRVTLEECLAAHHTAYDLQFALKKHLEAWEEETGRSVGLGDDGFGDLCAHVVGLGRAEFERVMAHPASAVERARRRAFRESFTYVFQYAEMAFADREVVAALRARSPAVPWDGGATLSSDAVLVEHPSEGLGVAFPARWGEPAKVVFPRGILTLPREGTQEAR